MLWIIYKVKNCQRNIFLSAAAPWLLIGNSSAICVAELIKVKNYSVKTSVTDEVLLQLQQQPLKYCNLLSLGLGLRIGHQNLTSISTVHTNQSQTITFLMVCILSPHTVRISWSPNTYIGYFSSWSKIRENEHLIVCEITTGLRGCHEFRSTAEHLELLWNIPCFCLLYVYIYTYRHSQ